MSGSDVTTLRRFIIKHFNWEELRTLCQDLGVDFDSLGGEGKEGKARELVTYMDRHTRLNDLFVILEKERPRACQSLGLAEVRGAIEVTVPAFWKPYFNAVSEAYQDWHIPDELRHLIDWQVNPVPIDDYLALRPVSTLPLLRAHAATIGKDTGEPGGVQGRGISTRKLPGQLLQIMGQEGGTVVLIMGDSGAGKSTILKYLCNHYTASVLTALEQKNANGLNLSEIPVYVPFRQYGPTRLMELISAQFRQYGLSITSNLLDEALENISFVFLLDGLDEVNLNWRDDAINELEVFRQQHPRHHILVTTRIQPQPINMGAFETYAIEPLTDTAICIFAQQYLGNDEEFTRQINQRGLTDLIRVPLLLTLALIVFKRKSVAFDNLADVYQEIVLLYRTAWEEHKKTHRLKYPLPWDILEETLSDLAYRMVSNGGRYTMPLSETLEILKDSAGRFSGEFRWPGGCTVDDLLNQLLIHNFLMLLSGEVSFWHTSFRDYFAALAVVDLPEKEVVYYAQSREWAGVTAFVGGLLPDPRPVRDALVGHALDDIDDSAWPVYTLSLMGSNTTGDIIRACSVPLNVETLQLAERLLKDRGFEGVNVFHNVWELLEYPPIEEKDWALVGIEEVSDMYENIMLALSAGNIPLF
jgi:hypothetical protein